MPKSPCHHKRKLYTSECAKCGAALTADAAGVDSFPDRTRARTVARHAPPLVAKQLYILNNSPYDTPRSWPHQRRQALVLARLGLLEEDPQNCNIFRVTEAGADVVRLWANAGWVP